MSDFGTHDGSVSELYGVIDSVNPDLKVHDLCHHIPPFSVRTAAYRLFQVFYHWAPGTIFVCAIDPEVGTDQIALLAESSTGHYFVAPNNGVLTFVDEFYGLSKIIRLHKEKALHPLAKSHTSYGRDLYAYIAARWASGLTRVDQIGVPYDQHLFRLPFAKPHHDALGVVGSIEIQDSYGNAWTNMDMDFLKSHGIAQGNHYPVCISDGHSTLFKQSVYFGKTYGCVAKDEPVLYINSMHCLAIGIHWGNFYKNHHLSVGTIPATIGIHKNAA
jgi:S-adenosylmethionine hydrolase